MKLHLLDYGNMEVDVGWFVQAAGVSTLSAPTPASPRRKISMVGALIEHPKAGLILYETGAAPNAKELWPAPVFEAFAVTHYDAANRLDEAVHAAGFDLADIKAVVIGHMHLDHAGGLEFFRGMDVPIYVHEEELKNAFYAVATGEDLGPYVGHYVDTSFNWKAVQEEQIELWDGITLYRAQGHTPGLLMLRADLPNAGTFLFTSDLMPLRDNYEQGRPQGWLGRDQHQWWRSFKLTHTIAVRTDAHLVFGHDYDVLEELKRETVYD